MSPFDRFPKSDLDIVAPDGTVRCTTRGVVSKKSIAIDDTSITIESGDEIRRKLPNGREEVFIVNDPTYFEKFHSIPAHYQVTISRKGAYPQGTGGHYINVSGHNARVNIGSIDQSSNVVHDASVFRDCVPPSRPSRRNRTVRPCKTPPTAWRRRRTIPAGLLPTRTLSRSRPGT